MAQTVVDPPTVQRIDEVLESNLFREFNPKRDRLLKPVKSNRPWLYDVMIMDGEIYVCFVTYSSKEDVSTYRMFVLDAGEYIGPSEINLDKLKPNFEGVSILTALEQRARDGAGLQAVNGSSG